MADFASGEIGAFVGPEELGAGDGLASPTRTIRSRTAPYPEA